MAKQRVQVAKLNAPTQANLQGGTAPVVETMRVLAPDQTPETPLSQFVSAIAPAMEADAADRRIKRLKREQEIQNGIRAKKENQLEQARISLIGDLTLEYAKNETTNLDMGEAAYLEKRQKAYAPYLDKLRSTDLEPELIDALEGDLALADVTFMKTKYAPSKVQRNYDQLDEGFKNTLLLINQQVQDGGLTLEGGVEQIAAVRQSFLEAHPERYDDAKINDQMVMLADADTVDPNRVNSPLVAYLAGPESKNQLNVERNREVGAKIAKRQAAVAKTNKSALQKVAASKYAENLAKLAIEGDFKNLNFDTDTTATIDGITFTKKFGKADILVHIEGMAAAEIEALQSKPAEGEQAVAIKEAVIASAKRRHFAAYAAVGGKPPEVSAALRDAKAIWQGDMNQFDMIAGEKVFGNLMIAEKSFNQLAEVEDYLGSEGISQMFEGDKKSLEMYRTIKSAMQANKTFKEAIDMAQRFDIDTTPKITITTDDLSAEIDPSGPTGWFTFTNLEETANLSVLSTDAENLARIKKSTNPLISEEDAKSSAIKEVAADYRAMTMPDGTLMAIKAESGSHQELQLNAAEQALKDAMQNKEFVDAVSKMYNYSPRLIATSILGVESVRQVGGFSLLVQNDTTNANQLQVYAVGTDSKGKISTTSAQYPLGKIDLTTVATQQKFKFIDDAIGTYQKTVEPILDFTPEEDIELNYTPTVTKPLVEMTFDDFMETDTAKDIKKAFSLDNDILQRIWKANVDLGKGMVDIGKSVVDYINPISDAGASIIKDEGFSSTVYVDTEGHETIGHGLKVVDIEPDERALIKDINNVTEDESKAVVALKVNKITDYFSDVVDGFENLPTTAKSGLIQMGYQLGRFNVTKEWPKFMESIKEAAQYAEGSIEQGKALAKAKFNMLYNVAADGTVSATKWATQTKNRAMKVADTLGAAAGDAVTSVFEAVIPKAHADTDMIPSKEQLRVGDIPTASAVADIAMSQNPADAAYKYYGIDENTDEGAKAVKGFFETSVGNWNPNNQSVEEFATNQAWCAAFLTQVLRDSGIDTKALFGKDKFDQIRAKAYTNVGTQVENTQAKAGDIMIKQHTKDERKKFKLGFGHVGVVVKVEGDEVFFIGGNTGDKVTMSSYNMKEKEVMIRRLNNASDIPTETLPSMLQLKAGVFTDKLVKKTKNLFTSMYNNIFE